MNDRALVTAIGIGFSAVAEEHIFTFMLSSPMTARTIVREKNQVAQVHTDLLIATGASIAWALLMAFLLEDIITAVFGIIFGLLLYYIYAVRGGLL
jgi:hypothetical protein